MLKVIANALVVTRHAALVEYLLQEGVIVEGNYTLVDHATPEVVKDKDVIGVLPHSLSCLTTSFTEVAMKIPAEMRGMELTLEDMNAYAGDISTYIINKKIEVAEQGCIYCHSPMCVAYTHGESVCG